MSPPDRIAALTARRIADVVKQYAATGRLDRWERDMLQAITQGHTAAAISGTAERLGTTAGGKLLNERNLSRAERDAIKARVKGQLPYLRDFADQVRAGELSEAELAARAALYAGATRATWSEARWFGASLPAHPADGSTECLVNCKCNWVQRSDGYYWTLGTAEHCPTCNSRASAWAPWRGK